jgi:hypothetical protein
MSTADNLRAALALLDNGKGWTTGVLFNPGHGFGDRFCLIGAVNKVAKGHPFGDGIHDSYQGGPETDALYTALEEIDPTFTAPGDTWMESRARMVADFNDSLDFTSVERLINRAIEIAEQQK